MQEKLFENKFYLHQESSVFKAAGKDAERYLQARLTNDIKSLPVGSHCLAACLSPQGKTEGLYIVYKESPESFQLLATAGESEQLLAGLKRFLVADQLTIEKTNGVKFAYLSTEHATHIVSDDCIMIHSLCFNPHLSAIIAKEAEIEKLLAKKLEPLNSEEYLYYQLSNKQLEFPKQIKADSLFVEYGIYDAISSTKGCYTGQEVVERVISLGKLPAKINTYSFEAAETFSMDDSKLVDSGKSKAGDPISIVSLANQEKTLLLARVKRAFLEKDIFLNKQGETIALKIVSQ